MLFWSLKHKLSKRRVFYLGMGFTLIELLVTITLIALTSGVGLVTYSHAQMVARDARRKQDLKTIAVGLELFFDANGRYPESRGQPGCTFGPPGSDWCASADPDPWWIPEMNTSYLNMLPRDPRSDNPSPWFNNNGGYAYYSNWSGSLCPQATNHFYGLVTTLENVDDQDRNGLHHYTWCSGEDTITDSQFLWSPYTYVIISKF